MIKKYIILFSFMTGFNIFCSDSDGVRVKLSSSQAVKVFNYINKRVVNSQEVFVRLSPEDRVITQQGDTYTVEIYGTRKKQGVEIPHWIIVSFPKEEFLKIIGHKETVEKYQQRFK